MSDKEQLKKLGEECIQNSLEMNILKSIKKISQGLDLMVRLQLELISHRSKFKNQIAAYIATFTEAEIDDLLYAIVKDNALPKEEICLAFDLNLTTLPMRIERIKKERGIF